MWENAGVVGIVVGRRNRIDRIVHLLTVTERRSSEHVAWVSGEIAGGRVGARQDSGERPEEPVKQGPGYVSGSHYGPVGDGRAVVVDFAVLILS